MTFDYTKIVDWIKLSPKYLIGIAIFSGFLIFVSERVLDFFGLIQLVSSIRPYLALVFIASSALLLAGVISFLGNTILIRFKAFTYRHRLKDLTPEEKEILKLYIDGNTRSQEFSIMNGTIQGLVADKILYRSTNLGKDIFFSFNIKSWAWRYLKKNRNILE